MKKTMMVLGVALCATLLVSPATACDGKDAKQVSNQETSCSSSAAKAAYAKTLEETGCSKTAQKAYNHLLRELNQWSREHDCPMTTNSWIAEEAVRQAW